MRIGKLFLAIGVFVAVGSASFSFATGFPAGPESSAPYVVVKGLAMLQLEHPQALRIALPDAPGHKATITFVMQDGSTRVFPIKGHGTIEAAVESGSRPVVRVPELVRIKELYGDGTKPVLGRVKKMVSIPWSAILKVSTEEVTASRYTFDRTDSGLELDSFRPRQVAESVRIELSSAGSMTLNRAKTAFDSNVREIRVEHAPESVRSDAPILEHFHHIRTLFRSPRREDLRCGAADSVRQQ